jgi:ankyrin repeat protein
VEALLNKGAIIDDGMQGEDKHETPLHMAALFGHTAVIKKLLRRGADINAFSPDEVGTVVNGAIYSGNREAIKLLIEKGASLSTVTSENSEIEGPLALAAQLSEITMFDYFIEACADKLPAQEYDKALVAAAEAGRVEIFNKLLAYNHPQECFQEALDAATEEDNWDIIMILLERCKRLDCKGPFDSAACDSENMDKVLEAVWRHTNGIMPEDVLDKALRDASWCGKFSTVDILLEFGANPNAADEESVFSSYKCLLDYDVLTCQTKGWELL